MPGFTHLLKRADFLAAAAGGRKWATPGLVLQAHGPDLPMAAGAPAMRVGFTASRKVGNAVARNRAKRRLRAAASQVLPSRARVNMDYVLIARAGTLTRPYDKLVGDLEWALKKTDGWREMPPDRPPTSEESPK